MLTPLHRALALFLLAASPLSACGDTDQSAGPGMTEDATTAGDDGASTAVPTATEPMGDTTGMNPAANAGATGMGTNASGSDAGSTGLGAGTDASGTAGGVTGTGAPGTSAGGSGTMASGGQ